MDFSVEFYETTAGRCPVQDFLDVLKSTDPGDFAAVMAGLARMRQSRNHRPPLSKAIGDGLYELRHVGKLNTRLMYFFMRGRRIVVVHGIRNKGRLIARHELITATKRMADWIARHET